MTDLVNGILDLDPTLVYLVVTALVFAEDALFVGFVIPAETAAILGGVVASKGRVNVVALAGLVVAAAVLGDSVGYQLGRRFGTRILRLRILDWRRARLDSAQDLLRRRGGLAMFLGRFVAFFRAVMPALAGTARMRYCTFLAYNAAGGIVWGIGYVLLGYLAGDSYQQVAKTAGTTVTVVAVALVVIAVVDLAGPSPPRRAGAVAALPGTSLSRGRLRADPVGRFTCSVQNSTADWRPAAERPPPCRWDRDD